MKGRLASCPTLPANHDILPISTQYAASLSSEFCVFIAHSPAVDSRVRPSLNKPGTACSFSFSPARLPFAIPCQRAGKGEWNLPTFTCADYFGLRHFSGRACWFTGRCLEFCRPSGWRNGPRTGYIAPTFWRRRCFCKAGIRILSTASFQVDGPLRWK